MQVIDLGIFIKKHITHRSTSLFEKDLSFNHDRLNQDINGKSVLVIGGAGTIGSSFIKVILKYKPAKLFVVDINENGLTELTRDLRSTPGQFIPREFKTYPMNFSDDVFEKMFKAEGPFHIVANFAAHKHVRSEKDKYSIEAMIDNNVFKAKKLMDLLLENKPEKFFCVSTDKAANPVNVMGATKKLMEEVIMAYSRELHITTARFANVAFSKGSLLDGYMDRLMKRQPLSCPSDVKRFFVSPEESGQICLLACMLGESGDIFFPKLDEENMVYFKQITEDFLMALGLESVPCSTEDEAKEKSERLDLHQRYPVYYFGSDTSGEKLYEEFYTEHDDTRLDIYHGLGVIKNARKESVDYIGHIIDELRKLLASDQISKSEIVALLSGLLPDFHHIETGKSLDQKM